MLTHQADLQRSSTKHPSSRLDCYGPWAVVTGASDGIGRAIATKLAAEGFSLALVARRKGILSEFAEDLNAQYGTESRVIDVDLGSNAGIRSVEARTKDLDVGLLVAAAGFGTSGPFVEGDLDAELDMIAVNCEAIAALAHVFARRLVKRGRGGRR
ncbi:MAG: SDR family NAD(P)-dependent oxidoreductase [Planctomycetota bacterium]